MNSIKIIRLQSGEDIIAMYAEDDEIAMLAEPMQMIVKRTTKGSAMFLLPWLPVELIKENMASIYLADILTTVEPKEEMIAYYGKAVESIKLKSLVDKEIMEYENSKESEEDLTEVLRNVKIGTVH